MPNLLPPSTNNSDNLQKETIVLDDNYNNPDTPEFLPPSTKNSDNDNEDSDDDYDNENSDTNEDEDNNDEDNTTPPNLRREFNDDNDTTPPSLRSAFSTCNQRKATPNRLVKLKLIKAVVELNLKKYPICGTLDRELCNKKRFRT